MCECDSVVCCFFGRINLVIWPRFADFDCVLSKLPHSGIWNLHSCVVSREHPFRLCSESE